MIKFFRSIRKKIISENKSIIWNTNYIKYAIGEIFLVVIGILIALQINNWNQDRKIRAQEFEILSNIQSELRNSKIELEKGLKYNISQGKRLRELAQYIEDDLPYSTELDSVFGSLSNWFSPFFSYTSYETLKIKGVYLIQNQTLRENIVKMYERTFPWISKDWDQFSWAYAQSVSIPLTNKHVRKKATIYKARPNDFEQLKKNVEFNNMINYLIVDKEHSANMFSHFSTYLDSLILDINIELSSKNKE